MKKIRSIIGAALFLVGFFCSFAQKQDGGPAPLFQLGGALVMLIGGNVLSTEFKNDNDNK